MPKRMILALTAIMAASSPVHAQNDRGGVRTETQERVANGQGGMDAIWNFVGLFGLLGLLGLRQEHAEDSYHPAALE
jgi:hypothetical protein